MTLGEYVKDELGMVEGFWKLGVFVGLSAGLLIALLFAVFGIAVGKVERLACVVPPLVAAFTAWGALAPYAIAAWLALAEWFCDKVGL